MGGRIASWDDEARAFARVGAELADVEIPTIEVRLSRAGAEAAVEAWRRDEDEDEDELTGETTEQRVVRVRAGGLALIGAAIEDGGRWFEHDVLVRLGADLVSAAVDAFEDGSSVA